MQELNTLNINCLEIFYCKKGPCETSMMGIFTK